MAHHLKIYMDPNLNETAKRFTFPRTEIGTTAKIDFYIKNTSKKWPLVDIDVIKLKDGVTVENLPQVLKPEQKIPCVLKWKPSMSIDDPLSVTLDLKGDLHIG